MSDFKIMCIQISSTPSNILLQAVVLLEYIYILLTRDNQSDVDVKGEVSAEIKKFLDFLVEHIDLKAKDTADFFNVLRSFKTFTTSVTEAVRVTYVL